VRIRDLKYIREYRRRLENTVAVEAVVQTGAAGSRTTIVATGWHACCQAGSHCKLPYR